MSLRDTACYTLLIIPSTTDGNVTELIEAGPSSHGGGGGGGGERKGEVRYARVREKKEREAYSGALYDYLTGAKLGSVGYETFKAKKRRLQLHGPDEDVSFEFTGMINFEWTFAFQGNKFKWTREVYGKDYVCAMDRKPDPKVEICLAREPDKSAPGRLQILHYNIDRFPNEITDLRGLETLLITTYARFSHLRGKLIKRLLCFLDASEERRPSPSQTPKPVSAENVTGSSSSGRPQGPERIVTPEFLEPEQPNEVLVGLRTSLDEHVARAVALLEDPKILFVVIRTRDSAATQRALEVSLGVTRFRHRESLPDLHQYVVDEEPPEPVKKGPKVIKLDDEPKSPKGNKPTWTPPKNVAIYLSTIALPEFSAARRSASSASKASKKPAQAALSGGTPLQKPVAKPPKPGKSSKTPPVAPTPTPPPPTEPPVPGAGVAGYASSAVGAVMNAYQAAQARYQNAPPPPSAPSAPAPPNGEAKPPQGALGWLFKR